MIKVHVSHLKPGMKLSKDVFVDDGKLLLLSGFIIKPIYIEKLENFKVPFVYVNEDDDTILEGNDEEIIYNEAIDTMRSVLTSVRQGGCFDVTAVKETVKEIADGILNDDSVFLNLTGIRDIDSYTFQHSVDVCIYSLVIGKNLGLSKNDLMDLGIGAILHDIGKCKVPLEILKKPGKLTNEEFDIMKLHTVYGYEIINNTYGLNSCIAHIAWNHHEKWDGTGYPRGLYKYRIDKFSRIVTTVDIYDALTANRVYKKRDLPHEAAEYIMGNSSILFDPDITNTFIKNIAIYPQGCKVLLNTGEIGSVIEAGGNIPIRPRVRIIEINEGLPIPQPYVIDLSKKLNVFIADVLN